VPSDCQLPIVNLRLEGLRVSRMIRLTMTDSHDFPSENEQIRNLVVLREFTDLPEAAVAKSVLESASIKCIMGDHRTIMALVGAASPIGGFVLCVSREDASIAAEILGQEIPENFNVEGVGQFHQPRCPNCQSLDISLRDWDKRLARFVLGVPGPTGRRGRIWFCHSRNHEWPDSNDFPEVKPDP
jgi:hypothetical protein